MGVTRTRKWGAVIAAGVVAAASMVTATGASATTNDDINSETVKIAPGESQTATFAEGISVTTELGDPEIVSVAEIRADSSLTNAQKSSLSVAAAAGTVKSNHYSQFTTGGAYTVTHNGTFYYNGSRVWVGQTYNGKTGSHRCFQNYAVGIAITTTNCTESGTTTRRDMFYSWNVGVGPATYGVSMTAKLYSNGTISGFGATVG